MDVSGSCSASTRDRVSSSSGGSRARQIADDEARCLVDERRRRFVRDDVMVQNRRVRERFYRCHADEGRKLQIGSPNLFAMALEVGSEESIVASIERLDPLKLADARDLLRKHPMQLRIDAMCLDRCSDEGAHTLLYRLVGNFRQFATDELHNFLLMPLDDRSDERLLAGEVLIE